jgi:predicted tellurium resistance membrane protein TerC|tara:strand:- start:677 stop:1267 length:591 start_codon:yes stop_codon:yes gene_type:complete
MSLKYFISGFFVKAITGFDDTMVHIPVASNITRTRQGRIAFSLGILFAIIFAIIIAFSFASAIKLIPYHKYISAGLILFIALSIYLDLFSQKPRKKIEKKIKKFKGISGKRFFKLFGVGFLTALATVIDDTIAYSSLFLGTSSNVIYAVLGILTTTFIELAAIIYFSKKISKFKYKKEVTFIGLLVLVVLILTGAL